jgi:vitamin B12 transporter
MYSRILVLGVFALHVAYAQNPPSFQNQQLDEVVVSDSRFPLKRSQSGKTVIKLTSSDLQKHVGKSLAAVINQLSGIEINGSRSYAGQNLSYFIRGGNNRQVLVLIDGIPVSDPSRPTSDFDLTLLSLSQIDSVEIVKGASSTLYGSGAATAVILISTKKATQNGIHLSVDSSSGTNNTQNETINSINDFNNSISIQMQSGAWGFLTSYAHQYTDGISAVVGDENDPLSKQNIRFSTTYNPSSIFSIRGGFHYDKYRSFYDDSFSLTDADNYLKSKQMRYSLGSKYKLQNGAIEASVSFVKSDRQAVSNYPNDYQSSSFISDLLFKHRFTEKWLSIVGVQHTSHSTEFTQKAKSSTTDPYINIVYLAANGFHANTGLRFNNHSEYGSHLTYSLNPSFVIGTENNYWKIMASYSSAFIAPSLSYLFGPFGANPDLQPEENKTAEVGVEFYKSNSFNASVLLFTRKEINFIDYLANGYENVSQNFRVEGIEFALTAQLSKNLAFKTNYTYTNKKEVLVLRIPSHKINASLDFQATKQTSFTTYFQYNSERNDADFSVFPSGDIILDSYQLLDVSVRHQFLNPNVTFSLSVTNILDESYQEIYGFSSKGRNCSLGMQLRF